MNIVNVRRLLAATSLSTVALLAHAADTVGDCRIGAYRLTDGSVVDIAPSEGAKLRWRRTDGTTGALSKAADGNWASSLGWTEKPDGNKVWFSDCGQGQISFNGKVGQRIAFDVSDTMFDGDGVKLAGRLVMPKGSSPVPIAVLIHGAESDSARDFYYLQRMLPSQDVGVFVYDKRGTGASGGKYSQDFKLLANDAVAALREARRLAGARAGRVGYQAGSQGGWVAPLAAMRAPVDFVIVGFGLAVSVLDEDSSAAALNMTMNGYGPDVVAKAKEVTDATAAVVVSGFKDGLPRLDEVREKYKGEPWFKHLHGNFSFLLLAMPTAEIPVAGQAYNFGTPWNYDPMPTLRALKTPQLWILGQDDMDAPSAETLRLLNSLASQGQPVTTALYPNAEHGILEYETAADGTRLSTRNPDGYFRMMCDYIRSGRLDGSYGSAKISFPKNRE